MTWTTSGGAAVVRCRQRARRHGIDVGVGRILLVGEELGVLAGARVGVSHLRRLGARGGPGPQDVVPVTPAVRVAGCGAVEVGAAVAVVVHPGEIGPERRVVQREVRTPAVVVVACRAAPGRHRPPHRSAPPC